MLPCWVQQSPPRERSKCWLVCEQFQLSGCCIITASWTPELLLWLLRGGRYLTQQGGHCMQYPFCACAVLLHKGEELPFPHCGRVVQTFELDAQKEENVTCLFVSFPEVDEAGMDKGQMQTTSRSPHFPPTEMPVAGWRVWLRARLGVVIYCWPLMAINYYMPSRRAVVEVDLWLRGGSHTQYLWGLSLTHRAPGSAWCQKNYLCVSRLTQYKVSLPVADYKAVYFPWSFLHTHYWPTRVQWPNSELLESSGFPSNRLLLWNPRSSNSMRRQGGAVRFSQLNSFYFAFYLWTPSRSSNNITKQKALWLITPGTDII